MSKFQEQYKKKTCGFGNPTVARTVRTENHEKARRNCRSKIFAENRNILNSGSNPTQKNEPEVSSLSEDHINKLQKWKIERERRKKVEQMNKKRPFIVGVVHDKMYPFSTNDKIKKKINIPPLSKKISKVTEKRLMLKAQSQKVTKSVIESSKSSTGYLTKKQSSALVDQKEESLEEPLFSRSQYRMSINNFCNKNTENINMKTSNKDLSKSKYSELLSEPVFFSPYVVCSRGKSNARTEQQMKRGFNLSHSFSDKIPTKDTVMKNLNISIEDEERTAQYFQFLLNAEIDRLNELCDKWTLVKEELDITEDAQYQINQAIGQTQLLINKKFERFRGLVCDCETGKGEMLVTCKDLQGFWDMMYMEVKNCDLRFDKLEQLRLEGWKEREDVPVVNKLAKKKTAAKKIMPKTSSSIRAFIAERKEHVVKDIDNDNDTKDLRIVDKKYKTRSSSGSRVKTSTLVKHDRTKLSLLQKVQLSETKKFKSPLTMMKVSQMCKTPEVLLDDTICYINSDQTPRKSILKQPKKSNGTESCTKTSHKVNFDDTVVLNEVPMDEETQTKLDLAKALARIDSFEFNSPTEEESIHAERKLSFDDNSFQEFQDAFDTNEHSDLKVSTKHSMSVPSKHLQSTIPISKQKHKSHDTSNSSLSRSLRRRSDMNEKIENIIPNIVPLENTVHDTDLNVITRNLQGHILTSDEGNIHEHNESIRILRNRSIISINTPIQRRKSGELFKNLQQSEHKENMNSKIDLYNDINTTRLSEKSDRRKSKRNVKFSEDECNNDIKKPLLPVTPHIKRRKSLGVSSEKKKDVGVQNITSFETIAPARIRRSQNKKKMIFAL